MTARAARTYDELADIELAGLVARRDPGAVRLVTQRNNQRLFRVAWSILKNRAEAEDAVQSGYLKAFTAIDGFAGRSSLSTWLTRIVLNEALGRQRASARRRARLDGESVLHLDEYREKLMRGSLDGASPDASLARQEIRQLLEQAIAGLPPSFRIVFVLREVEGLSVEETADALAIPIATVKTRALRARRRLQQELAPEVRAALAGSFPFAGADCAALTEWVLENHCGR